MKKFLGLILVICCCAIYVFGNDYSDIQQTQANTTYVYICTGGYATKYHCRSNCSGLGNCKGSIKKITEAEAIKAGRTKCSRCYK